MTPEARASVAGQLLGWLPLRLRQRGRVLRCAGGHGRAPSPPPGAAVRLRDGARLPPASKPGVQARLAACIASQLSESHNYFRLPAALPTSTRSSELTNIITRGSGEASSGGALARKLAAAEEGTPLVGGRGYKPA